jgi:hypothetical protein
VAFASKKFNAAERNYHTEERELLAVIHALKLFRCYLDGPEFTIYTDHNPLTFFDHKKDLSPRQARWAHYLSRFTYKWEWIKGVDNPADFLSRNPAFNPVLAVMTRAATGHAPTAPERYGFQAPQPVNRRTRGSTVATNEAGPSTSQAPSVPARRHPHSRRKKRYDSGVTLQTTEPHIFERTPGTDDDPVQDENQFFDLHLVRAGYQQPNWHSWFNNPKNKALVEKLVCHNGVYYMDGSIVVPDYQHMRKMVLHTFHDANVAGHLGQMKTLSLIKRVYWWPGMKQHVYDYVKTCHSCQKNKVDNRKKGGLLKNLVIPDRAWQSISMDFIVGLPKTPCGKDAIAVVVDRLTKMVHFIPCSINVTAFDFAKLFVDHIFKLHGSPKDIVSDRDPRFTSTMWREFCRILNISQNMSSPYQPQTDGQTERMNRVLEEMLRHYVAPHQGDWIDHLALCEFAINNAVQDSTGHTPFFLNYGFHPHLPVYLEDLDVKTSVGHVSPQDYDDLQIKVMGIKSLHDAMLDNITRAKQAMEAAQKRQKNYYDKTRRQVEYGVGSYVLLSSKDVGLKVVGSRKLLPRFIGPFKVIKRVGELAYRLELPESLKIHDVFHVSRFKPFFDDGRVQPPPLPINVDGELEYEVEKVYGHRDVKSGNRLRREYLVRWKGYGVEYDEYVPVANFGDSLECIQEYWAGREAHAQDG